MAIHLHKSDLPKGLDLGKVIAVDTETMGLNPKRDRLCLVQISSGDGDAHLVQLRENDYSKAPRLKALLGDQDVLKIFHYARFDVAVIYQYLDIVCTPVYCTKIASRLARTFTDKHGLRDVCRDLVNVELNKQQQSSDWGAETLTEEQKLYAANDVLYLHGVKERLDEMLTREGRENLAQSCFDFLPSRAFLDLHGWAEIDIFQH